MIETPVGFKYIGDCMRNGDIMIGGEESGGISFKGHIPEKDGIAGNLMLVEMMAYEKKPLSRIWADFQKEVGLSLSYRRADLQLTRRTQKAVMDRLLERPPATLAGEAVTKVGRSDGLKLYIDHYNWFLIRRPGLSLYCASTPKEPPETVSIDS